MLNSRKTGLLILDNVQVDHNLPKHKKPEASIGNLVNPSGLAFDEGFVALADSVNFPTANLNHNKDKKNIFARIFYYLFGWMLNREEKPKMTVAQFFANVKEGIEKIELYEDRVNSYLAVAAQAKKAGQTALFEHIMEDVEQAKFESLLLASGFDTCITEQQVVDFYKQSDKGLSLTYIKNFTRIIPEKVLEQKDKADAIKVFDNYCILHYDATKKAFKLTQNEKKDPILFGLIKGVNKLYYIADWIDSECDLTLKQIIDKFGEDAIKANNITVNYSVKKDK